MKKFTLLGAMALVFGLATAPTVEAGVATAKFNGVAPGLSGIGLKLNGANMTVHAGAMNWTYVGGDGLNGYSAGNSFYTFCIELTEHVSSGATYTYDIVPRTAAPFPGLGTGGSGVNGPMNAVKSNFLGELWANFRSVALDSNTNAAAFQMAVWEVVYDEGLDLLATVSNNFRVKSSSNANVTAARNLAQNWLNAIAPAGNLNGKTAHNLVALSARGVQDQITEHTVPEPTSLAAWGLLGGVVFAGRAWRNRRRS